MKITFKILIAGLICVTFVSKGLAEDTDFQAGLNFTVGLPQDEFKENIDNTGFGGTGFFGYNFGGSPFIAGLSASYMVYGSESRKEPFSTTIPDVTVDVTTTNSILLTHLMLRVQPQQGIFRPYLDGLFGFNYLSTDTKIQSEHDYDELDEIASSTNFDDFTFSYGGGAGLMFRVYEDNNLEEVGQISVFVDLGIRYIKSGDAEYLKEGSISRYDGKVSYDVNKSTTDLVTVHIGVSVSF